MINPTNCCIGLAKNGNEVQRGSQLAISNTSYTVFGSVSGILYLAVNDTVSIFVYTLNASSTIGSSGALSYFQGNYMRSG